MTHDSRSSSEAPAPGTLAFDDDGVAWLLLDDPAKKVNTLSSRMFEWFEEQVSTLERDLPKGLVIHSGKPDNFVAGADIEELRELTARDRVLRLVERGHELTRRLDHLPFPTAAAIHGSCLGGGLELALCCDVRIATDHEKTKLGLPEVQLGLIPGMGGTQRLPRLIGVPDALDLILTGSPKSARSARRLGLVDEICHPHDLLRAARELLLEAGHEAVEKRRKRRKAFASRAGDLLAKSFLGEKFVYDKARDQVRQKTGGHYPAPLVAVDIVKDGMELPLNRALELEAGAFSELAVSDTAKALMGIFFMKNDAEGRARKIAEGAREVGAIGVLGAGFMGSGVAQGLAYKGYRVVMKDQDWEAVGRGMKHCAKLFGQLEERRKITSVERQEAVRRILGTVHYRDLQSADFVVEAVFEDLDVKHQVIRETEEVARQNLIFASNTSTLPIAELAEASRRPENVVGMHFFSPVHKMPLLEIIRHPGTSEETLATTVEVGRRMGKTIIVVNDGPGFFTSRVLGPMMNEAAWILTEGASIPQIDEALTRWGWPVGAITLFDEVGLDIAAHAGASTRERLGHRLDSPPVLQRMIDDGRTGRKGGRGFYLYEDGKRQGVDESVYQLIDWEPGDVSDEEIVERCWMQMLNETARCMEDGVIENPVDVEIGVIFGFGFPPFRGGLLKEADRVGLDYVVDRLDHYAEAHGERLRPADLLRDMAKKGERFHAS